MARRSRLTDTVRETLHFFHQGKTVSDIAQIRGLKDGTIYSHLEEAMLAGEAVDVNTLLDRNAQRDIADAFKRFGFGNLSGAVESLRTDPRGRRRSSIGRPRRGAAAARASRRWRQLLTERSPQPRRPIPRRLARG